MDPLLLEDKVAGALWGLLAGETLASPVEGWSRDRILRVHGRVVHRLPEARPGSLSLTARRVAGLLADRRADPAELRPHLVSGGAGAVLTAALLAATIPAPALALAAKAGRDLARSAEVDDAAVEAAGLVAVAAAWELGADAFLPIPVSDFLEALRDECWSISTREALAALALDARSLPSPDSIASAHAELPEPLALVFTVFEALLLRRRAAGEAVVLAVNLGGAAMLRGALTGALAGLQRGAAALPESWTLGLEEARPLPALARGLIDRRQRR